MIPQLCGIGVQVGLTGSQNMLFRHEPAKLQVAYLTMNPLIILNN